MSPTEAGTDGNNRDPVGRHSQYITLLLVIPYPFISLAAGIFHETLRARMGGGENFRLLVRSYQRVFSEVDISFVRDVLLFRPDLIGFSSFFWNLDRNSRLAALAKTLHPGVFTVFGGPQAGGSEQTARRLLQEHRAIDAVLRGEADLTFPELAVKAVSGEEVGKIPGLAIRKGGHIGADPESGWVPDLRELPLVYHPGNEWITRILHPNEVIPLQTLRGCRRRCSYCLYHQHPLRFFPLDRVAQEISFLCSRGIRHVRVCDSHFGGTRERAHELFRIIESANRGTEFSIYPDPDHVDRDYIQAARRANCRVISIGVETMDPDVASCQHRRGEPEAFPHMYELFREAGETPQVDMMYGLPRQSRESFRKDLVRLRSAGADHVLFSPLMVFPGTDLGSRAASEGISLLECPQRYGYPSGPGVEEYASLMTMVSGYQLLVSFHRADWYLRSRLKGREAYPHAVESWFAAVAGEKREEAIAFQEEIQAGSVYLREHATVLAERAASLFSFLLPGEQVNTGILAELARMDVLEIAMRRRRKELARDISPRSSWSGILLPEELVQRQLALHQEARLVIHPLPYELAAKGEGTPPRDSRDQVYCCYFSPESMIYFMDEHEYRFLQRFQQPSLLFDAEHVYSSEDLALAARWSRRGVLVGSEA